MTTSSDIVFKSPNRRFLNFSNLLNLLFSLSKVIWNLISLFTKISLIFLGVKYSNKKNVMGCHEQKITATTIF